MLSPRLYQSPEATAMLRRFGPYVGEQLTVWCPARNRYGLLLGLPCPRVGKPLVEVLLYATAEEVAELALFDESEPVGNVLPVLYGFEALPTEMLLPDGRVGVPIIEVLRLATPALQLTKTAWAQAGRDSKGADIRIFAHATADRAISRLTEANWPALPLQAEVFGLLQRAHFATPGLPKTAYHPRVVGFDYTSGEKPGKEVCGE